MQNAISGLNVSNGDYRIQGQKMIARTGNRSKDVGPRSEEVYSHIVPCLPLVVYLGSYFLICARTTRNGCLPARNPS
jgi:hypothetical protein